jgi:hypothetical protein
MNISIALPLRRDILPIGDGASWEDSMASKNLAVPVIEAVVVALGSTSAAFMTGIKIGGGTMNADAIRWLCVITITGMVVVGWVVWKACYNYRETIEKEVLRRIAQTVLAKAREAAGKYRPEHMEEGEWLEEQIRRKEVETGLDLRDALR